MGEGERFDIGINERQKTKVVDAITREAEAEGRNMADRGQTLRLCIALSQDTHLPFILDERVAILSSVSLCGRHIVKESNLMEPEDARKAAESKHVSNRAASTKKRWWI